MERRQYKKSQDSKRAIMDATRSLAEKKGYDKTSMRDIARESGFSIGAVYHHYNSKDAVMNESFLYFDDLLQEETINHYDRMDPLEALKALMLDHTIFIEKVGPSLMREYYRALLNGKVQSAVSSDRAYYRAMETYVKKAQEQGELRADVSSEIIAEYLVKCLRGVMVDWCLHAGTYSAQEKTKQEIELFIMPWLAADA